MPSITFISTVEAAKIVGVNPKTLKQKRLRGELPGVRCGSNGKSLRWVKEDLERWLLGEISAKAS
jgi:hypothetical protein